MLIEPKYKGVVFDLDGTLINSIEDLTDSINVVLDYYDLSPKTYQEGYALVGKGLKNLVRKALPRKLSQVDSIVDEAYFRMVNEYSRRKLNKTKPYPEIPFLLKYLNKHQIPISVSSNKKDTLVQVICEKLFDGVEFSYVKGLRDGEERKPNPQSALLAAEAMGVDPKDCLYVGDSEIDYQTAKNAGMQAALVDWGFSDPKCLDSFKDALRIDTPIRVIDALKYGDQLYRIFEQPNYVDLEQDT